MERIYPRLKGIKIDYAWGGTIGVTANRVPQLGKLANNIYFSQGYSGHGVNVTHLAGRTMAEAVAGTSETLDVFSAVKPFTVPGIRRWPAEYMPKIFDSDRVDRVMDIGQEDAEVTMRRLAKEEGIFCGVSSGGAVAAALQLSEQLENAVIVAIICDRGDRYLSTGVFPA